jgi:hypothetical protein
VGLTPRLYEFEERIVRDHPTPPRQVAFGEVLRAVVGETAMRIILIGALGWLGILALILLAYPISAGSVVFAAVAAFFGGWFLYLPYSGSRKIWRALSNGVLVEAEVTSVAYRDRMRTSATFDAMQHGLASGTRKVPHPLGEFTDRFRFDRPGASRIRQGTKMLVLVDPAKRRVARDLGLAAASN